MVLASPTNEADEAVRLPSGAVEEQYQYAFDFLQKREFKKARQAFEAFIEANPDSDLTENARYWRAETFYVEKDYVNATSAFLESYEQHPSGQKAPDSLLKLALSLAAVEQGDKACTILDALGAQLPRCSLAHPRTRPKSAHRPQLSNNPKPLPLQEKLSTLPCMRPMQAAQIPTPCKRSMRAPMPCPTQTSRHAPHKPHATPTTISAMKPNGCGADSYAPTLTPRHAHANDLLLPARVEAIQWRSPAPS